MPPPKSSSGMGYERKKRNLTAIPITSPMAASSSSNYRYGNQHSASIPGRSPSPPASAYFPLLSGDNTTRLRPTPDADAHFAYSTTLRRHQSESAAALASPAVFAAAVNAEATSLWTRAVNTITGRQTNEYQVVENGRETPPASREQSKDTASGKFAHMSAEATISYFRSSGTDGLLHTDINTLREHHGYNEFSVSSPEPLLLKFAKTIYESPLILLLCASATISAIMGNIDDAVSITVAVLIVLTVGFVQERRSEKSLEALNKLVPHHCHVIREGEAIHVLANELVPGDLVKFATGDRIPADIRLVDAIDLEVDESSLTGETEARRKDTATCRFEHGAAPGEPVALAERTCIVYMGTLVRNGRGTGIVIATGAETEFGVIFSMMQDVEERRTPLQLNMDELAKKLSFMSFGVIGVICLIGVLQKRSWLEMFTIGVSLAVAAIPEGLPIVTTVTLALGVLRMAKRKAIVKKLHSVESLGSVSVICSDKTGTLTKNEQTVTEAYAVDETLFLDPSSSIPYTGTVSPAIKRALDIGALCNNASLIRNEDGVYVGQSTDVALLNVLQLFGVPDRRETFKRLAEKSFNSEQKYMAVSGIHEDGSPHLQVNGSPREMYYIKGSIEAIIDRCKFYYVSEESTPALDANTKNVIMTRANATAARGLRVIAMAFGYGSANPVNGLNGNGNTSSLGSTPHGSRAPSPGPNGAGDKAGEKTNLVFVGFQAMLDPPRKGVADSINLLQSGGVQVVMITGDAEPTALSIAQKLGLRVGRLGAGSGGAAGVSSAHCLTGKAIDQMTKAQLKERVGSVSVFARTTPKHKMAIVEAFQARGKIVAMTGDGVNDAPALKMADIGISMGKSGTDVAKEAADMILVDDNFSTILPAVEEGKSIFHNIQNFLSFQLSTAAAALTLISLSTMLGLDNPLNAMQILFINILMDGPPSQSLGVDPVDPAVMRRPPRKKNAPIITKRLLCRVLFSASIIVVGTLFVYVFALKDEDMSRREQTMTFTAFVFLDLVSAIQNRGLGCALFQNKMLITTVSISFLTQLALVYVGFMQKIFQTDALGMHDLGIILGLAGVSLVLHEGRRWYERRIDADDTYATVMEELA
ncbi:Calcium-transporting ATPase 1 [Psilocybe cubensis]|uniref:Calcium-transporting ATPase 1 n=1 Tax=Psilocybe cubensis TaxID=181762 RepID=A0ACB8HCG0_PSICU|nr:Calcium-transporting ATPase 1 [Psilocybe cubensis]KAH9485618.1 Calcium-transporting ATPase 1 [Psilocybe cubensis]